jgi:8-oxo-dGTP pyrophosphatase MutT (NUDIX family)
MRDAAPSETRFLPATVLAHIRARLSLAVDGGPVAAGIAQPIGALKLDQPLDDQKCAPAQMYGSRASVAFPATARAAAVLVGLVDYKSEIRIILTQRSAALRVHSGEIAFPGGTIEPRDEHPLAAALREANEEIGLDASRVEPLGYLDPYFTGTGFRIVPVVVKIEPPVVFSINPHEVTDAFEVPFAFLMDAGNHALQHREIGGASRQFYAIPYRERHIWGVTAGILRNLYERLYS